MLDAIDKAIVNGFQNEFPLTPRPFAEIGARVNICENETIRRVRRLLDAGLLWRVGPLYQLETIEARHSVCAIAVPDERWDEVVAMIDRRMEVARACQRDHALNIWFVLSVETQMRADEICSEIERETDLGVLRFPLQREFLADFTVQL